MAKVAPYHSGRRARVHHDRDDCRDGRKIAEEDRRRGTGGLPLCFTCAQATSIENARNVRDD